MVNSFQSLTSAVKNCIPDASDASWPTSALQMLSHKHFLIYVNQFQHKTQEYIHSLRGVAGDTILGSLDLHLHE